MTFEEGLRRLEDIVETLEKGDVPLEEALAYFEEGMGIVKYLDKKLEKIQARVSLILEEGTLEKEIKDVEDLEEED